MYKKSIFLELKNSSELLKNSICFRKIEKHKLYTYIYPGKKRRNWGEGEKEKRGGEGG